MAISNSTTLNDLVGQIVSDQAVTAAYSTRVARPLISGRVVPPGNASIVIPKWQALSVASLTEGTAPTSTTLSTDGVTLTPVERGVYVEVSKRALYADPWQDLAPYGDQLGRAMAQDEDLLVFDAMEAAFTTVVNDAGDALVLDDFLAAISTLEANNAPGPYFGVFHPYSWAKIRKLIGDASAFANVGRQTVEGFGQGFTQNAGYVGSPFGVPCFVSSQISPQDATPTHRANYVFSQQSFACAWLNDIRIDVDDNIVGRKIDMMAWYTVDCDVLRAEWGVQIHDTLT
jgi:N4-gp56 family major capsid protein